MTRTPLRSTGLGGGSHGPRTHRPLTQTESAAELAQVTLHHRATHDDLTGLLNRAGLVEHAAELLADDSTRLSVLFVDLDQFKAVNDQFGHSAGDGLLTAFARRLAAITPDGGLLARTGGDEFVLVLAETSKQSAHHVAESVLRLSHEPVTVGPNTVHVTASVGASGSDGPVNVDRLLREADIALLRSKSTGRERITWFDATLRPQTQRWASTDRESQFGVPHGRLVLHYQPAFDLIDSRAGHVEALVRWQHPTRGMVPPGEFIPLAEESGLVDPLGEWVISQAATQAALWADVPNIRVWVNVTPRQLATPGLAGRIARALRAAGATPARFGVEVTESAVAAHGNLIDEIARIRALGVAVAIDDFGTGHSSLARLAEVPVDVIKVDRAFVRGLANDNGYVILEGIVHLAHSIGAKVVAEGVETKDELAAVIRTGCDSASGFLLARPGPAELVTWQPAVPI